MYIQHVTIENFGAIRFYNVDFTSELNLIESRHTAEIAAAIAFLLCNKLPSAIPEQWLQEDTRISATVSLEDATYVVCAKSHLGQLQISAVDPTGADTKVQYQYELSHCPEQDDIEAFDGQDKTTPLRLYRYYCREDPNDLSGRTGCLVDTKTFRRHLYQYIQNFRPEPINSKKNYQAAMDSQGKFQVFYPGFSGDVYLSETEQKLFHYICFLNVAEFWADIEKIRDMHHEKKPLVIENFLEFLDDSTDIQGLIARTVKLQRQVLILTPPMQKEMKQNGIGKDGFYELLFESGN